MKRKPKHRSSKRSLRTSTVGLMAATSLAAAAAAAQDPVREELAVVESSILLQRVEPTRVDGLVIEVDGSLAEPVAVYSLDDLELPTTVYVDLCATSFTNLAGAVGMVAAVSEQLLAGGPVSVVAASNRDERLLLAASRDALAFRAALTVVLRSNLGGCETTSPLAGLARLRRALGRLDRESAAPSLLLVSGFDHRAITAEDLGRFQAEFATVGAELAGQGRTPVVLVPAAGDRRLQQDEVEPLLGDPDGPPRAIDLASLLGKLLWSKRIVPEDSRIIEVAIDPHNELLRELIVPGRGRLFAFPRQLEAFTRELSGYHVLFYRSTYRRDERSGTLVPIEVRARSGGVIETSRVTSRATAARPDAGSP